MRGRVLKILGTLACSGAVLVATPAIANADLYVGGGNSTVTSSNCDFDVTTANQSISSNQLAACLTAGDTVVTDDVSSGEPIDLQALTASTCGGGGQLSIVNHYGSIADQGAVDLGTGCSLTLEAEPSNSSAEITQTSTIQTPTLTTESGGETVLNDYNAVASFSGISDSGAVNLYTTGALAVSDLSTDAGADVSADGALSITGAASVTTGTLTLYSGTGAITQTAAITAPSLNTNSGGSTTLAHAGNQIGTFVGSAYPGTIDLIDDASGGLNASVNSSEGLSITNAGNITLGNLSAQGYTAVIAAQDGGSVTQPTGEIGAATLAVSGSSVSLLGGDNQVSGAFNATSSNGNITAHFFDETAVPLGTIQATGGTVSVSNNQSPGALQLTGPIQGQSINLTADGITATSGNSADLEAPAIAITDTAASDAWTITPRALAAEGAGSIAYTGATSLSIDGGASFNVTPSSSTTMSVTASGTANAGTLTYNAGGATITGATSPPSGTIDGSGLEPVSFAQMGTVSILGAASAAPPATTTTTTTTPPASTSTSTSTTPPTATATTTTPCSMTLAGTKIKLPKLVHGKRKGRATLTALVTCSQSEHVSVSGSITVTTKHGKHRYVDYTLPAFSANASPDKTVKITIDVPAKVEAAAGTAAKLTGQFVIYSRVNGAVKSLGRAISAPRLT